MPAGMLETLHINVYTHIDTCIEVDENEQKSYIFLLFSSNIIIIVKKLLSADIYSVIIIIIEYES